ncbi:molybdopterin-containing oxidoreductase family protein [Mycolicibacterium austroafricanum]|uniref:molybdopterin-containing oxidoreductase family protein n=1 Tax=Mycolicibacterium austroafricanum TaxID=39687 RepID=UPI001CA335A3|nr:molybdopterin-dependent oxidoreductase [Mycolicibacterium austroafricanum]QZT58582.1 molybdopterin-dependent oxidoreductase [Mycolicibacterium austroafricanum]
MTIPSYCRICESLCGIVATVEDGKVISIGGDAEHPVSKGYICAKGASMGEMLNDPDRVTAPLKRDSVTGTFVEVEWDDALDDIATRLNKLRKFRGPNSIALYFGNPASFGFAGLYWAKGLLDAIGSHQFHSPAPQDSFARQAASVHLFENGLRFPIPDVPRTQFFLCVGANPLVSHGSLLTLPRMGDEMRAVVDRGGRVVVVDPVRTRTAAEFEHVQVRPGTDAWLLAAMLNTVFVMKLHDERALENVANGWRALASAVEKVSPECAAEKTGIDPKTIVELAVAFATAESACAYSRCGLNRYPGASVATYLLDALNVVTGNLDREGGAVFGDAGIDFAGLGAKFGMSGVGRFPSRATGLPDMAGLLPWTLTQEIEYDAPDSVRGLLLVAGNPVVSCPDGAALERAMAKLDIIVSVDLYVNESNRHADYILPAAHYLEREDFPGTFLGHMPRPWLQYASKVVEAPVNVREDWEIIDDLTCRMGLGAPFSQRSVRVIGKVLRRFGVRITPNMIIAALLRAGRTGWTIKQLRNRPHGVVLRPHVRVGRLDTHLRGGRVNLGSPEMLRAIRELAAETGPADPDELRLVGRREVRGINSWNHNIGYGISAPTLWINRDDADARGLLDGDIVRVMSRVAAIEVPVQISDAVGPGTVSYPHGRGHGGGWRRSNSSGGANVNLLASAAPASKDPLSGGSHLDGIPVKLERCGAQSAVGVQEVCGF